ncbi:MAG: DUF5916 domain-containing protein [Balneolaceae bacterium]|nr:DUF5916 domain-containing protein [Balneolaceae bacterium]
MTVDGRLDESAWDRAERFSLNYEVAPGENVKPPVSTSALMLYSDTHLFVAFRAGVEEDKAVKAHLMDRDDVGNINQEDIVGLRIDTFNDARRAFEFLVNPLGVQFDGIFQDQGNSEEFSWDAIWESDGRLTADGYTVELAIPFESLRFPRSEGRRQTWRVGFIRVYPGDARHQILNIPLDYDNSSFLEQLPEVTGFKGIRRGSSLELNPTITSRKSDSRSGGELDAGRITAEPGATATWDVTSNLTLSATANPDFSQVEADALRLQENARFVLSFPEKRPFFVEGSELFDTPMQAVFTRTVLDPISGVKAAGKSGSNVLGLFGTLDHKNTLVFPRNQSSSRTIRDRQVWNTVLRYQRDIGDNANAGMIYNGREATDYYNRVAGVDGFTRFWNSNSIELQYLHSFTNYPSDIVSGFGQPAGSFEGDALSVELDHSSRRWFGELEYRHVSPQFRGDGGFFPRADFRTQEVSAGHIIRGDADRWFSRINLHGSLERTTDFDGTLTDREWDFAINYSGPMRSSGHASLSFIRQRFMNVEYDLTNLSLFGALHLNGSTRFRTFASFGEEIDFTNNRKANEVLVHPGLSLRLGRRISLNADPIFQRLETLDGRRIFTTWLLNGRLLYHFNVNTFVRALVRYRHIDRNPGTYVDPVPEQSQSLFGQLLFNYKLNPRSVLFIGLTHNFGDTPDRQTLRLETRTLFLKMGYVFQL